MGDLVQMIGKTFSRLTVIGKAPLYIDGSGRKRLKYLCSCACGKELEALGENLRSGHTTSCGCQQDDNRRARRLKGLIGNRHGRLTIIGDADPYVSPQGKVNRQVTVRCDCGTEAVMAMASVRCGLSASCGCYRSELAVANIVHGDNRKRKQAKEYKAWTGMIARCENSNTERYPHYGGRGIEVCKRWRDSYEVFLEDMGRKPSAAHSIDRVDVNGNYEPTNCRWATPSEQARNKRPRD